MKQKLSLCVITGNAEKYVGRFLEAFAPLADEIVLVRAIGNQTPDKTLEIAKRHPKVKTTAEYLNTGFREGDSMGYHEGQERFAESDFSTIDWPHVDDFAAARNMAFSLAKHDLIMWADMDDVIDTETVAAVRDAVDRLPEDFSGLVMDYYVPEDGLTVSRERIIRKGAAEWESPIHEFMRFHDPLPKIGKVAGAVIVHAASGNRASNDERNLRILESIPEDKKTPSHRFHTFQSLRAVGRVDEAREYLADLIVKRKHEFEPTERYELYIALGQLTEEPEIRAQLILQAVATDPTRREAFGEMVLCSLGMGNPGAALAWAEAMNGLSIPQEMQWNSRSKYYGYAGVGLHAMALRANGRREEADAIQTNHFIRHGAKISLIHATRGRGRQATECRRKWLEMARNPDAIEHIFALDFDDEFALPMSIYRSVILPGDGGPVAAWNAGAKQCAGEILIQLSDDWEPTRFWDDAIIQAIGDTSKPSVLWISDGHRKDQLLCMAICTRERIRQQGGYFFHPDFFSMYSDNWFSYRAFMDEVVIDARDRIRFEHIHPMFGLAEVDETYARSNTQANYRDGEGTYNRLVAGTMLPSGIPGWFDFRAYYKTVADRLQDGDTFAEVGVWLGQSLIALAQMLQDRGKDGVKLIAVDTFKGDADCGEADNYEQFMANIEAAGVADMIQTVRADSVAATFDIPDGSLAGCFIDAAHDYVSASRDIEAWRRKVREGGILGGHDYPSEDVARAVADAGLTVNQIGRCWEVAE